VTTYCLLASKNEFIVAGVRALVAADTVVNVRALDVMDTADLVRAVAASRPDVLILDEGIQSMSAAALQRLRRSIPGVRVIILNHEENVLRVYQGTWFKEAPIQSLAKVIDERQPRGGPG
jgi:DNA-binding NarL/FixJ family response regulator